METAVGIILGIALVSLSFLVLVMLIAMGIKVITKN